MGFIPFVSTLRASPDGVFVSQEEYVFFPGSVPSGLTTDINGTLRMVRSGDTLAGYYRSPNAADWTLIGTATDTLFYEDFNVFLSASRHSLSPFSPLQGPVDVVLSDPEIAPEALLTVAAVVAVPEPPTYAAASLCLGVVLVSCLRRRWA